MPEQRKHKRFIIEGMDVQCKMLFATEVKLLDISLSGASLLSDKKLNMGGRYSLKVECDDKAIKLSGLVVWEQLYGSKRREQNRIVPTYKAGLQFDDVLTDKGADLVDYIRENTRRAVPNPRVGGLRIKILNGKTTLLGSRQVFYVKKISMGGLLVESHQEMETESRLRMELLLPEEETPVRFSGRIVYCNEIPDKIPRSYNVGIEFVEINFDDKPRLTEFISHIQPH